MQEEGLDGNMPSCAILLDSMIAAMAPDRHPPPTRVVVNGRLLVEAGPPFARLSARQIVDWLRQESSIRADIVVPRPLPLEPAPGLSAVVVRRSRGAAVFDHYDFPRAGARLGADLLLSLHESAPMAAAAPVACIAGESSGASARRGRVARSLDAAGLTTATVFRMSDALGDSRRLRWVDLPAFVPRGVGVPGDDSDRGIRAVPGLPEAYVLALPETPDEVSLVLAAWTWVDGSLGDSFTLILGTFDDAVARRAEDEIRRRDLRESVRTFQATDGEWPRVFRGASALVHPGVPANPGPLRWALVSGVPIVAIDSPRVASIVGPAAYLVPPGDSRGLGAACLTLLVEESVASELRTRGLQRAATYHAESTRQAWLGAIRDAARPRR